MTRLAQGKRMHRGERVQHEDERSERYTLKEGERTPLLCNTHRGYRCIVTLLSPHSPLTENLRAYSKSRFPARWYRAYMSSNLLCSFHTLCWFLFFRALFPCLSLQLSFSISVFTDCSDAFRVSWITLMNLSYVYFIIANACPQLKWVISAFQLSSLWKWLNLVDAIQWINLKESPKRTSF